MSDMVDLRGGYGSKAVGVSKARGFLPPTNGQLRTWGTTAAVAGGAGTFAGHQRKHGDRRGGAAGGALAGAAGTDAALGVGGYALRERKESIKRGVPRTKASRKELSAHKAKYGVVEGPGKNPPNAFYRNYPKGQPAYKLERALGWKNNKYVVGGTLAAGAAAGAARGGRKQPVHKASLQLTRNGKNVLHLEQANPSHRKIWGAPARMLVVGSGEKLPAGRVLLPTRRQWANWGGGAALGVAGKKAIDHQVKKDDGSRRRRAVAAGAVAGAGTTDLAMNVGGWGTREGIKYHESLVNAGKISHPMSRKARSRMLDDHKAKHGVGSNTKDAPQAYYREWPHQLPGAKARRIMGWKNHPPVVGGTLAAGTLAGAGIALHRTRQRKPVSKVDTTMSDREAHRLAQRYDTRGPLPKTLSREEKMKAYEARYIASGGRKAEGWKRRADAAEVGRNVGLAGVTAAGAVTLGHKAPLLRRIPKHAIERAAVGAGTFGGASELYGEHARSRRASYQNSPGGVAGSALSRMQAYTPGRKS